MKQFLASLFIFLLCGSLSAQTEEISELESEIEKYIFKKPDSAKIYLYKLLAYSNQRPDTTVAETYSKLGITYNQLAVYDSATYYFEKGIKKSAGFPKIQAGIYSNNAINYRTSANYTESLAALEKAMELYQSIGDRIGEGVVYGEMASNFSYMAEKEKAITHLETAIEIFKEANEPRLYILQQKLANAYYNNENYEFAVDLYEEVLPEFAKQKGPPYYFTLLAYAESLVKLGKIKEGEKRLMEAKDGLEAINNLEYMHVAWGKLGKIYKVTNRPVLASKAFASAFDYLLKIQSTRFMEIAREYLDFLNLQGDYNKGLEVIERVKNSTNNFQRTMNVQDEMNFLVSARETFRKKGLFKESLTLFDRIDFLKDSLKTAVDRVKIKQLEESYQNKIQRDKNIALEESNALLKKYNAKQHTTTILSWLLTILTLILSVVIYTYHKKRLSLQKVAVTNLEKANTILNEKRELEQELLAEKEKNLADKERELVAISLEVANIQKQIKDLIEASNKEEISDELSTQIINTLNQLNYWKHFKSKFIEVHPEFGYNLIEMFPSLSEDDIAFCSLLKLQLTDSEIASLMGVTEENVTATKYRIKSKMQLQDNDEDFEKLIREL
ncbi:tetratricopeptide repeat protein [Aequorivita flava]|uniref:Tetratricopeptide repeat protein n=1 Tax=Aequorivita flava TaxID=3114371 RepID=A0AB35YY01_9FLAO